LFGVFLGNEVLEDGVQVDRGDADVTVFVTADALQILFGQ
jgi:hypothetical protein